MYIQLLDKPFYEIYNTLKKQYGDKKLAGSARIYIIMICLTIFVMSKNVNWYLKVLLLLL